MKYALLIYENEAAWESRPKEEMEKLMADYYAYGDAIEKSGHIQGGEALHPVSTATTVTVRNGETLTTDGPFAETKEQLGGFYLVEAKDLDEAVELAARIPSAPYGSIEVRPVMDFSQEG
ncbi:MAG: YciI family protein [Actinobacteria bacterium]|nr:YciI family protein [Actinomycetota bacterium]